MFDVGIMVCFVAFDERFTICGGLGFFLVFFVIETFKMVSADDEALL